MIICFSEFATREEMNCLLIVIISFFCNKVLAEKVTCAEQKTDEGPCWKIDLENCSNVSTDGTPVNCSQMIWKQEVIKSN